MSGRARTVRASRRDDQTRTASIDDTFLEFLETVPDAMMLSDHHGRILLANTTAEWMFGYSRDELTGKEIEILVPKRFQTRHRKDRAAYYADPSLRPMGVGRDVWGRRKDGIEFPVEISLSPVEISGKALVWSAIRNVSDRERTIAQVREVMKNKRIVLGGLISICAWCKRIRDEGGSWMQLESYIESHSKAKFSHGICRECLRMLDPTTHKPALKGVDQRDGVSIFRRGGGLPQRR